METYITLMQLTDQGIKNIKDAPGRIEEGIKNFEAMGGRMIGFYGVLGQYDYIAIAEVSNAEVGTVFNLGLGALGNVRTTTMRAFTTEEFTAIVNKMP